MRPACVLTALSCVLFGLAPRARADDAAGAATTPSTPGQAVLAARVLGGGLAYRACPQTTCVLDSSTPAIALPLGTSPESVHVEPLTVAVGRHLLWAHAPAWSALIGAASGATSEARVLWSGATGWVQGEDGERHGDWIEVGAPDADGVVQVLVGEVREDVSICGRPSILAPRVLDARDLTFKAAIVQRLRREEREGAPALEAVATPTSSAASDPSGHRILQAASASSGIGSPLALTDGDFDTTWSEKRGGDGRGEFVQMNAPEQVEITALSFVARPPTRQVPKGAGPRKIWVATADALFAVTFRDDPWARPGAEYTVKFPAPIRTHCLALVLDQAYVKNAAVDVDVTLAEVTAHSEFDGKTDPAALAGALAGGQARARMAAALLARGGEAAYAAAAEAYPNLDDAGRLLALEVVDSAACSQSAPVYLRAMQIGRPGEVHHAADHLIRCGRAAAFVLAPALENGSDKQRIEAARLLSLVAPDLAVDGILKVLPAVKTEVRSELRAALTHASQTERGKKAVVAGLADPALSPLVSIDLLRAATVEPVAMPEASAVLARLTSAGVDFRTRYLLLGPAASLAQVGDERAEAFLLRAVTADSDSHIRARAAEVAAGLLRAVPALAQALGDADPRVREAALASVARLTDPGASKVQAVVWPSDLFPAAARLLEDDPFTFVRVRAAESLRGAPAGEGGDAPLARALSDPSPLVRGRAVDTLGARGARRHAPELRSRLDDAAEALDVRVRAARALGRLCDAGSVDRLAELVQAAAVPAADGPSQVLGASAAAALVRLNPPDLTRRLSPLTDARAPRAAREIGKTALAATDRCPKSVE